jgi:FG-GAP repeat/Trypsin
MSNLSKTARVLAVLTAAALVSATATSAADAAGGGVAPESYGFVVKLEIGAPGSADARACTGALIRPRVVVTSRDCVVSLAHPDPEVPAALAITARFRSGDALKVVDVQPTVAPGLALAVLSRPAKATPVVLATAAAAAGEELNAAGFGRTRDEWVHDQPHAATFAVQAADATQVQVTPDSVAEDGLCLGDAGAPLARVGGDGVAQLVAVATAAYQKGCLGSVDTKGDAIARPVSSLPALPAATAGLYDQLTLSPTDSGSVPVAGAGYGTSVAAADFNKDGTVDIAVGAPGDVTGPANDVPSGTVTVFTNTVNGPSIGKRLLQADIKVSDEAGDQWGYSLATGDFNKDTYPDLAIGVPGEVVGTIKAGAIAIFNGSKDGLVPGRGFDQNDLGLIDLAGDEWGKSLAAGDFNGDGVVDLAVGAPGKVIAGARSGQVIVLKGVAAKPLAAGWVVDQKSADGANEGGDLFGASLAAGNVFGPKTGTVYSDLIVGAPGESPGSDPQSGTIFVIPGAAAGPVANGFGVTQTGNVGVNEAGDRFGASLATGDFNKDGWADIATGIPGEAPGTDPQAGTAMVIPGGNTALGKGYAVSQVGAGGDNQAGDLFGSVLATGDINGDGYADLVVGAPGRNGSAGVIYRFVGGAVTTARPNSVTPSTPITQKDLFGTDEAGDRFGAALALGDLSGDGKADVVVGSPGEGAPGEPKAGLVVTVSRAG